MGFWRLLPAGLGIAVPTMMQVGPDDAILNFCKWPRKIVVLPENCLPGTSASEVYLLAALLVVISLVWFGRPYFKDITGRVRMLVGVLILCCGIGIGILGLSIIAGGGDPGPAPHRPKSLEWVFSGMAGKSDAHGFRVSDIQFSAKNTMGKSIRLVEANIQSGIDSGKQRPLYLNAQEHGLISVHQANRIPADTDITLIAKFPDLPEGDFMKDWGVINFVIKDDEQTFSGKIEERQLREIFDGYRPKAPPPRVTKKIETTASDSRPATIDLDDNVDITIDGMKSSGTGTVIKGRGNAKGFFKDISSTFADAKFPLASLSENQRAIPREKTNELLVEFSKELVAFEAEREAIRDDEAKRKLWDEEFKSVYLPRARTLQSLIVFRIGIEPAIQDADVNDMRGTMLISSVRFGRSSLGHDKPIGLQPATNVINYLRYLAERMQP